MWRPEFGAWGLVGQRPRLTLSLFYDLGQCTQPLCTLVSPSVRADLQPSQDCYGSRDHSKLLHKCSINGRQYGALEIKG